VEAVAAAQKDLITAAQLAALGLTTSAICRRVARGALYRRHRGVYSLGPAPLSRDAEWLAAILGAGPGSALTHESLAELHGIWRLRPPLIAVVSTRRRRLEGVKLYTVRHLDPRDVTTERGIPVTTMHRMFVDLAETRTPHELANVIHEAAHLGRWVEPAVRDCAERLNGRHNLDVLEEAIALYNTGSAGAKSRAELALILSAADLPEFHNNVHIEGIEVDFHFPTLNLILEIDGPHHGRPSTRREDKLKQRILETAGYEVLRFPDSERPETIVAAVRARRVPSSSPSSRVA
jgi:hypothetical protein